MNDKVSEKKITKLEWLDMTSQERINEYMMQYMKKAIEQMDNLITMNKNLQSQINILERRIENLENT